MDTFGIKKIIVGGISLACLIIGSAFAFAFNSGFSGTTMLPFDITDTTLIHPDKPSTINGITNIIVCTIASVGAMCIWLWLKRGKEFSDHRFKELCVLSIFLVLYGGALTNLITNYLKHYRGGLRPHFIEACHLNQTLVDELGDSTYVNATLSEIICTAEGKPEYRWSFPSGHCSQAFYGMILSILIVNAYDWPTHMLVLKASIQFCFLTFATWVAISRIVDYHHHWWDALAGSILGAGIAYFEHEWCLKKIYEEFKEDGTENKQDAHTTKAWSASQRQAPTARRSFQIQSVV